MPEKYRPLLDFIPFIGLMVNKHTISTPIFTRLLETAIMSAVAGAFATYVGVELLKSDVANLKEAIRQVDSKVDHLDEKIERVRGDVYVPRGQ